MTKSTVERQQTDDLLCFHKDDSNDNANRWKVFFYFLSSKAPSLLKPFFQTQSRVGQFWILILNCGRLIPFRQMAMIPTTALQPVGPHHHSHLSHEGGVGVGPHHGGQHPVSHLHSDVSFDEFSANPFLDYSTSLHLSAGNPYAAVSAAAAAAAASGNLPCFALAGIFLF